MPAISFRHHTEMVSSSHHTAIGVIGAATPLFRLLQPSLQPPSVIVAHHVIAGLAGQRHVTTTVITLLVTEAADAIATDMSFASPANNNARLMIPLAYDDEYVR